MLRSQLLVQLLLTAFFVANANAGGKTFQVTPQQLQFCFQEYPESLYCQMPTFGLEQLPYLAALETPNILGVTNLLGIETATLPMPSPAVGFSFNFDRTLGVMTRSLESFGPILSDRAETIGARKIAIGFTYQHFGFDSLNGRPLSHDFDTQLAIINSLHLKVDEFVTFISWGVTRRIDLSVVFPVRTVSMGITNSVGVGLSPTNFFVPVLTPNVSKSSTGLSDIALRFKSTLWKGEHGGVGLGLDVRTPVGDPLEFQGAGAVGVKPFVVGSWGYHFRRVFVGPHVSTGFEWNGSSILGGPLVGVPGRLPRRWVYSVGSEVGLSKRTRTTVTLDLTGQRLFSALRTYSNVYLLAGHNQANGASAIFSSSCASLTSCPVSVTTHPLNLIDGSIGGKVNPWGNLLFTGNLSFRLNRSGLRARLVPLVGVSYTF